MQDDHYEKLDDQFVDRAWGEMSRLLDQEMPVAALPFWRRRWLLLLLLLLLGAGAIGVWGYSRLFTGEEEALPRNNPVAALEESSIEMPADALTVPATDTPIRESLTPTINNKTEEQQQRPETPAGRSGTPPVASAPSGRPAGKEGATNSGAVAKIAAPSAPVVAVPEQNDLYQQQSTGSVPEITGDQVYPPPAAVVWATLTTLSTLTPAAVSYPNHTYDLEPSLPASAKRKGAFRFGMEGGLLADAGQLPNGVLFGLIGQYHPERGRWTFTSGLHWQQAGRVQSLVDQASVSIPLDQVSFEDAPELVNAGTSYALEGRYVAELERTTYLTMPLFAGFRLNRNWQLEGGAQLSYLLAEEQSARYLVNPDQDFSVVFPQITPAREYNLADRAYEPLPVKRLDLAIGVGIGYYPGERLGFRLSYNHGLISPLESPSGPVYNRQFRLSAAYFLMGRR